MTKDQIVASLAMLNLTVTVYDTHVHLSSDPLPQHYALLGQLFAVLGS